MAKVVSLYLSLSLCNCPWLCNSLSLLSCVCKRQSRSRRRRKIKLKFVASAAAAAAGKLNLKNRQTVFYSVCMHIWSETIKFYAAKNNKVQTDKHRKKFEENENKFPSQVRESCLCSCMSLCVCVCCIINRFLWCADFDFEKRKKDKKRQGI